MKDQKRSGGPEGSGRDRIAFQGGSYSLIITAIVYYGSVIVFFLFLSVQSLEKRRYN